jgi:2-amino-4-hydroxy-6-hydroxymethyldihydropteridine diphosphokinase
MNEFCKHRNGGNTSVSGLAPGRLALIGVGANLPTRDGRSPLATAQQAVAMLDAIPGMRLVGLSCWFQSAPVPPSDQPPYINAVAALRIAPDAPVDPAGLLAHLMRIEAECGRERSTPNAARTLDLDIIGIGALVREAPDPVLPHPRAHLRAFVLAPLVEVAPEWIHPLLGQPAAALLAALPPQEIQLL